jgi:hypothetical protein
MKMIAAIGMTLVVALSSGGAFAGPVSIEDAEIKSLREFLSQDAAAAAEFAEVRRAAIDALDDKPNPIRKVVGAGHSESDPDRLRSVASLGDISKVEALAWTWAVTGETRYADKARDFIMAWATTNRPDGIAINETKFEPLIEAYDILRDRFSPEDRARIDSWLREKAKLLWAAPDHRRENWQSHRLKIVGLIGATIGDQNLWETALKGFKAQIADNFDRGGISDDFKRRDAMHYHLYTVNPLLTLSCVARRKGVDLFTYLAPDGASLQQAVDFIKPFALGKNKHLEFANSKEPIDRKRAAAGDNEYKPHYWNPRLSIYTFNLAGCLDPSYIAFAAKLSGNPKQQIYDWNSVVFKAYSAARPK